MFFGKIQQGLDPGREEGRGVTGDRYHRGPSFTIFLRQKSLSNKLNAEADPNCNKKGVYSCMILVQVCLK